MALSAQVVGIASGNTDTFAIPVGVPVPRITPTVFSAMLFFGSAVLAGFSSISDDAAPQDDYSFCLFTDGLNNYNAPGATPNIGGIANDLTTANTIVGSIPGNTSWQQVIAVNVTGIGGFGGSGVAPLLPANMGGGGGLQLAEQPIGGGGSFAPGVTWVLAGSGGGFPPNLFSPTGATDENWDWVNGELAFYPIFANDTSPLGAWSWADGSITDWVQITDDTDGSNFFCTALGMATVTPGAAGPSLAGSWAGGQNKGQGEHGAAYLSGAGPGECNPAPPTGDPAFSHKFRAA